MAPLSGRPVELDPKVTPSQDRARATYETILQATGELLSEVGIERLSTNMIAERAGLTPPALYRYFPNKYAILGEMGRRLISAENDVVFAWLASDAFAIGSGLEAEIERFAALLQKLRDVVLTHPGGAWIYRAMSAVPVLQAIRREALEAFSDVVFEAVVGDFPKVDARRVRAGALLTALVNNAVNESMVDDSKNAEILRHETARMMTLYFRDIVLSRASDKEKA